MKRIYFTLDENHRLDCLSYTSMRNSTEISLEVDDDHEILINPYIFAYVNGQLIKDTEYQQQVIQSEQVEENKPTAAEEIESLKRQSADLAYTLMTKGVL